VRLEIRPGARNLITDVAGLLVGNAKDMRILTGVTVVVAERSMVVAADIRGGAPGTRDTPALEPECLIEDVHAIVLSGGSVFGLDAASAVTTELARRGIGFTFGAQAWPCPVVPAAILFDLMNGGDKAWGEEPPYRRLGKTALEAAAKDFGLGLAGAGAGAVAGCIKGGLGSASAMWNGFTVGALVAVNSAGSCINGRSGLPWSIDCAIGDEMGPRQPLTSVPPELPASKLDRMAEAARPGANTTIAVVATDARLGKAEAKRLAIMAADGLAIAIRPLHTPFDGDTVFAAATGLRELEGPRAPSLARLGEVAALTLARAAGRAIWEARTAGGTKSWRDLTGR
jgi:L-aminopeptidase/D-esterase-like protein